MDPQDEILAACCNALDKAHELLSAIVRHETLTPQILAQCREWVDWEYDPGTNGQRELRKHGHAQLS